MTAGMLVAANLTVLIVAVLHFYFLVLEMFLWTRPLGLKVFRNTPEKAELTAVLAANQGLYNGFLVAGLLWSLLHPNPDMALQLKYFFLGCVVIAGIYGAKTVSRRILYIQALPAAVGILFLFPA
jgi:putative membrane protein